MKRVECNCECKYDVISMKMIFKVNMIYYYWCWWGVYVWSVCDDVWSIVIMSDVSEICPICLWWCVTLRLSEIKYNLLCLRSVLECIMWVQLACHRTAALHHLGSLVFWIIEARFIWSVCTLNGWSVRSPLEDKIRVCIWFWYSDYLVRVP